LRHFERSKKGTGFALIVASSAAAFSGAAIYTTWMAVEVPADVAGLFLIAFGIAMIVSLAVGTVIGLPLTWLLALLRRESPQAYLIAGLLSGSIVVSQLLSGWLLPTGNKDMLEESLSIGGIPGAISGCVWWLMSRREAARSENW
jgi:hypothetical protein